MNADLAQTIKLVFGSEGGYSNHPKDPGGATKYGITAATLGSWRKLGRKATPLEVQSLTLAEAMQILDRQYAQPIHFAELPAGLDYAVFDFAVNSGPSQAAKILQRILGVGADGFIGARTIEAIAGHNVEDLINDLCDDRMKFLRTLETWPTFGKGWTNRVSDVRNGALKMVSIAPAPIADHVPEPDGLQSAGPDQVRMSKTTQGKGAIAATIGVAGTAVGSAKDAIQPLTGNSWFIDHIFTVLAVGGAGLAIAGVCVMAFNQMHKIQAGEPA